MEKYSAYRTEDFLSDERFLDWVLSPSETSNEYWQTVFILHPSCETKADEARKILSALRIKPGEAMPQDMYKQIMTHLQTRLDESIPTNKSNHLIWPWKTYLATACIVICCVTAFFFFQTSTDSVTGDLVIEQTGTLTDRQQRLTKVTNTANKSLLLLLPDTSTVVLEANAYVVYSEETFALNREIYLCGEAFFEVTSNKNTPFLVKTDYLITQVLGTSFRIKAAKTLAKSKVSVQSGVVKVYKKTKTDSAAEPGTPVYLVANQEIDYSERTKEQASATFAPTAVAMPSYQEEFKSTPLKSVLNTISDQYHVDISIVDSVLEARTITASLQDMHLFEKLDLISKAAEASYRIVDGRIVFDRSHDN